MSEIKNLTPSKRPRERLAANGASSLSDRELLAILIGKGTRQNGVIKLAEIVLDIFDSKNGSLRLEDLLTVPGIGRAKAATLIAAVEFARRRIRPAGTVIRQASDLMPLIQHLADRKQEHFTCTSLNGAHEVIATRIVTIGLVNATQVHPREVFSDAITDRAVAIIVAHNHPSGVLTPSNADIETTKKLKETGEILGIRLLDHVIFSTRGFISLQEQGLL
ncbi:MAG: DNA repair protein RadC [Bdellovibrionales bacterium]|nr:DNA repair protein RadC [Bdellovibrionales bacterium]